MFLRVSFSWLILILSVRFSSETIIESVCNDKCEPVQFTLLDANGGNVYTTVFQMESADAFAPVLSLMIIDHNPYSSDLEFSNLILFEFRDKKYEFRCVKDSWEDLICKSGFVGDRKTSESCIVMKETNTCKWLLDVGMNPLVNIGNKSETAAIDMITQPNIAKITFSNIYRHDILADNLTSLPIYQWSYTRCCEYNKKIYDIDGNLLTLKKDENSFELFIYRSVNEEVKNPRNITLVNSKNATIFISCDDEISEIVAWTESGSGWRSVSDKDVFKKHIDSLRCGISLAINMETEFSSFSFNDTPLKLIHKVDDSGSYVTKEVTFESDSVAEDETKVETTPITIVDQEAVDENYNNDKVSPLIGVALTIITVVKSYFDLW